MPMPMPMPMTSTRTTTTTTTTTRSDRSGEIVADPEGALARELTRVIDLDRLQSAWQVRLVPGSGALQWVGVDADGEMQVLNDEPDATAWTRLKLWLLAPLVPESLL